MAVDPAAPAAPVVRAARQEAAPASGDGDYKYIVKYSHDDEASYTRQENSTFFIGTDTFHEQFGLDSDIELSGNPLRAKVSGSGPLAYTDAAYHSEQDGSFQSQGGVAGSPGACDGSSKVDLVGTTGGTATVVGLNITQTQITLDFRPGQFPYNVNPGGPPIERYHFVDTLDPCPRSDSPRTRRSSSTRSRISTTCERTRIRASSSSGWERAASTLN